MKILFITNLIPYPLDNGGKIKTYNILEILSEENEIDLFAFYENEKERESIDFLKRKFRNVVGVEKILTTKKNIFYMLTIAIKSIFSKYPFVILKYIDKKMRNLLEEYILDNNYDLIYIDHLQLGVYYDVLKKTNKKIYLDEHNCEYQILKRKFHDESSILKKIFFGLEYKKLKKFEETIINKVDKVIVLSDEDKKLLMSNKNEDKFINIPIPIKTNYKKIIGSKIQDEINLIFLGTLTWYPNAQGIEWFVDNVIPILERNEIKYKLHIVGKDPSISLIEKCKENDNVIITGYVDSIDEYIDKCDIMIVPIFIGSGMRVKILEGLGKRIPIISTSIGAEGIEIKNNKNILLANDENEFVEAIINLKNKELYETLQINGYETFNNLYSIEAISKKYKNDVLEFI